jgi:hypothetical protein
MQNFTAGRIAALTVLGQEVLVGTYFIEMVQLTW